MQRHQHQAMNNQRSFLSFQPQQTSVDRAREQQQQQQHQQPLHQTGNPTFNAPPVTGIKRSLTDSSGYDRPYDSPVSPNVGSNAGLFRQRTTVDSFSSNASSGLSTPQAMSSSTSTTVDRSQLPPIAKRRLTASRIHEVKTSDTESKVDDGGSLRISGQLPATNETSVKDEGVEEEQNDEEQPMSEYTQRTKFPSTPTPSTNPTLSLSHPVYGLPRSLVANFSSLGVNSIYPWQAACLLCRGHLSHQKNLVYSAPTGGGKSLVADVLMLKRVIEGRKKAILALPYVALVQEKVRWLRKVVENVKKGDLEHQHDAGTSNRGDEGDIRLTAFFGGSNARTTWSDTDIAVCTIEKANSLVNTAIEERNIDSLGVIVIDELHMIDDEQRGYLIEIMITKLMLLQQDIQIIGMSATLSKTEILAKWLHANYYVSKYKPIPIAEHIVFNNAIYAAINSKEFFRTASHLTKAEPTNGFISSSQLQQVPTPVRPLRVIDRSLHRELQGPMLNAMVALTLETARAGYGALIFCGSRAACQSNALLIAEAMSDEQELKNLIGGAETDELLEDRKDLLAGLASVPSGLDPVFAQSILKGVGFHHAGLTAEERDLVADAYDQGVLKVLVSTCTLAAGINLPARRVIICGARMGRELVGPAMLRQMRGRAGRKGKDEVGETFLCCLKEDLKAVGEIFEADMPAIASGLSSERRGVNRALLEAIATGLVSGRSAIDEYIKCTLLYYTMNTDELVTMVNDAIKELVEKNLIQKTTDTASAGGTREGGAIVAEDDYEGSSGNDVNETSLGFDDAAYEATPVGNAVVASSFAPDDGLFIYNELRRALQAFVLDGEMHVFYMFAPLQGTMADIDWSVFRDQINGLDESGLRAMDLIGVKPAYVNVMAQTGTGPSDPTTCRIYRRAYTAFQLRDLSNEMPLSVVARKYRTERGAVQTLAQTCHGFAAGMVKFCQRMSMGNAKAARTRSQAGLSSSSGSSSETTGWDLLAVVLDHMRDRLQAGARTELLELAQVAFVKGFTARVLWENGFKNVQSLAETEPKDLVPVLMMAQPRSRTTKAVIDGEEESGSQRPNRVEDKMVHKAKAIIASACKIWEREMLVEIED